MKPAGATWQFTPLVSPNRAKLLLGLASFDEIIDAFRDVAVRPMYWEPASAPHLQGCNRASFELIVSPDLYDAFFNSPVGYRGQFAVSERRGEAASRRLVDSLLSRLLVAAREYPEGEAVKTSLHGQQTKIWILESEVEEQRCDHPPSIVFPPWEFNEPDGVGLRAPVGTRLEVKGGWVNGAGEEVINDFKRHRSGYINRTGDSR